MDYSRIINRSFEIAWRYKSLWLFGLFASGGISNFNFNINLGDIEESYQVIQNFINIPPETIYTMIIIGIILSLVLFIMYLISQASLIDALNKIERGGVYRFGDAFSTGLDFFWRFLGLAILSFFAMIVAVGIIGLIIVGFFVVHLAIGIISLLILVPAILFIVFSLFNIFSLAQRALVVRNVSIGDALEEGYILFREHFTKNLIIFLIYVGFYIGFGIIGIIVWIIFGIPIAAIVLLLNFSFVGAFLIGLIVGLPISLVMGGIFGTFFNSLYTLFYFELVEPHRGLTPQITPTAEPMV